MKVNSISTYSVGQNKKSSIENNNVNFGKVVAQVAKDSYAPQVKKGLNLFMDYMRTLAKGAQQGDKKSRLQLARLIGRDATREIVTNPNYTRQTNKITKALPLSGHGTRGAIIRNMITSKLGLPETNKTDLALPAVIGRHKGKDIYLTTANNELLHMMEAKKLSPFERMDWITTDISEGDATVLVRGLEQGKISTKKPLLITYTDDVGTRGHEDYSKLVERYNEIGGDKTETKVISRGFLTDKESAKDLGVFFPKNGAFEVVEKPSKEVLAAYPAEKVPTNIGKTLITPAGLQDIDARRLSDPTSLTKIEKDGVTRRWHVTEGILKPAAVEGKLDVIPKGGQFADIGNGTAFTDTMVSIAKGDFSEVFPRPLEEQIQRNVKLAEDGMSATLNYGAKTVELPTSKVADAASFGK